MIVLALDLQKGIVNESLYALDTFIDHVSRILVEARKHKVEVIYVRHDDGEGSGFSIGDEDHEIYEGFAPLANERIFEKKANSAFHESTGLARYLKEKQENKIMIVGLQTDFCMDATIKSGFERGFEMIVPSFSNSTTGNAYMDAETTYRFYNAFMWPGRYARCVSIEEAIQLIHACKESKPDENTGLTPCGTQAMETERLVLRPFKQEDMDSMMRNWVSDDWVQDMYGEPSYKTVAEVRALLDKYIGGYQCENCYRWAIMEKASGECIGQIAYFLVDANNHFGEIEYCIGRAWHRKGYATEATKAVIQYGFEKIHFHKVQICCRPSNVASKKVIDKCGLAYEGTLRDYFFRKGDYEGRMYHSILLEEYMQGKECKNAQRGNK